MSKSFFFFRLQHQNLKSFSQGFESLSRACKSGRKPLTGFVSVLSTKPIFLWFEPHRFRIHSVHTEPLVHLSKTWKLGNSEATLFFNAAKYRNVGKWLDDLRGAMMSNNFVLSVLGFVVSGGACCMYSCSKKRICGREFKVGCRLGNGLEH